MFLDIRACLGSDLVNKLIEFLNVLPDPCLPDACVIRVFISRENSQVIISYLDF